MTHLSLRFLAVSAALVSLGLAASPAQAATTGPDAATVRKSLLTASQMAALTGYRGTLSSDGEALGGCEDLPDGFWCARALTPSDYQRISPAYVTITVYPTRAAARLWIKQAAVQAKASSESEGAYISSTPTEVDAIVRTGASRDAQGTLVTPATSAVTVDVLAGRLVVSGTSVVATSQANTQSLVRAARALAKAQAAKAPRT